VLQENPVDPRLVQFDEPLRPNCGGPGNLPETTGQVGKLAIAKFRDGGLETIVPFPSFAFRTSLSRQSCCFLVKIGGKMAKYVMNLCMAARMSDAYTHMAFPLSKTRVMLKGAGRVKQIL